MTDTLDRLGSVPADDDWASAVTTELEPDDRSPAGHGRAASNDLRADDFPLALPGRVLLATLAGAGAVVAFTLVAPHFGGSPLEALGLVVVAWLQAAIAIFAVQRPTRRLLRLGIALNVAVIAAWALSRTIGFAAIGHADGVAVATASGAMAAALAVGFVVVALIGLARPTIGRDWDASTLVLATLAPIAILALATATVALPNQGGSASTESVTAAGPVVAAPTPTSAPVTPTTAKKGPNLAEGESIETQPDVPLDPATQKQLAAQLVVAREAAAKYPTAGDAKRAGLMVAGGAAPGVGAHYQVVSAASLKGMNPDGTVNPALPSSYIYQGTDDDSPLVGLMYISMAATAPEGFAGPNDHWHRHSNLCIKFADGQIQVPVAPDSDVTKEQCDALGGKFMAKTVWMVHAWVVPGWESPKGVFSHDNPNVHCPDGVNPDGSEKVDSLGFCIKQ
jgi:hypothetical protein